MPVDAPCWTPCSSFGAKPEAHHLDQPNRGESQSSLLQRKPRHVVLRTRYEEAAGEAATVGIHVVRPRRFPAIGFCACSQTHVQRSSWPLDQPPHAASQWEELHRKTESAIAVLPRSHFVQQYYGEVALETAGRHPATGYPSRQSHRPSGPLDQESRHTWPSVAGLRGARGLTR